VTGDLGIFAEGVGPIVSPHNIVHSVEGVVTVASFEGVVRFVTYVLARTHLMNLSHSLAHSSLIAYSRDHRMCSIVI